MTHKQTEICFQQLKDLIFKNKQILFLTLSVTLNNSIMYIKGWELFEILQTPVNIAILRANLLEQLLSVYYSSGATLANEWVWVGVGPEKGTGFFQYIVHWVESQNTLSTKVEANAFKIKNCMIKKIYYETCCQPSSISQVELEL